VVTPSAPKLPATATSATLAKAYITYQASTAAVSHFVLQRATVGRRGPHGCVAVTARNRSQPRCTLYVVVARFAHADHVGANRLRLGAYVPLRKLGPGSYRLLSVMLDSAGRKHTLYTPLRIVAPVSLRRASILVPIETVLLRFASLL
jgi:hypothetical protein